MSKFLDFWNKTKESWTAIVNVAIAVWVEPDFKPTALIIANSCLVCVDALIQYICRDKKYID